MSKLVWRVKLVAELEPGVTTETEVACLERGEEAGLADLGLRLNEAKQLTAALQAEMVSAQVAAVGAHRRWCVACGRPLASKGYYRATFRSLFGDVPVRVRRLLVCPCHGPGEPKSFVALDLGAGTVAPELAYQPVDEVLVQSERRSKRMFKMIRAGMEPWATRTMRMASSAAPSVVGIVTLHPRKPKTGSPCRALGRFSAVTGRST